MTKLYFTIIIIESEKKDKYLDLARELKKTVERKSDGYTNCNWCFWYSQQRIGKRTSGANPKYSIAKIEQFTEKSPGDLKRLVLLSLILQ